MLDNVSVVVTGVHMDGVPPDTLGISGIPVLLTQKRRMRNPMGELHRIAIATQLATAVQTCMAAAQMTLREERF